MRNGINTGIFCLLGILVFSQRQLPIHSNFRDLQLMRPVVGPSIFPLSEMETGFYQHYKDTTPRYSIVGVYLYKRELIERKDTLTKSQIWITPVLDMFAGIQQNDSVSRIYQNTRGARLEGQLGKKLFFTSSVYENQTLLPEYARLQTVGRGEFYYSPTDSSYRQANGVISGGARTKPFKGAGFDYTFARANISWYVFKNLHVHFGNQSQFLGSGYRSMLWSDNSPGFMNLRMKWRLTDKLSTAFMRGRMLNLVRRPYTTNVEAWYERKNVSWSTISYSDSVFSITLFEGGMWSRGDSIQQRPVDEAFYIPLPGGATLQQRTTGTALAVVGTDLRINAFGQVLYGQVALTPGSSASMVYQAGVRLHPWKKFQALLQLEYNHADRNAYRGATPSLNYSGMNLPVAHPAANGFDEVVLRVSGYYKHLFFAAGANYLSRLSSNSALLPVYFNDSETVEEVINLHTEVGYRLNQTTGFEVYIAGHYRSGISDISWTGLGIRLAATNHYFDF